MTQISLSAKSLIKRILELKSVLVSGADISVSVLSAFHFKVLSLTFVNFGVEKVNIKKYCKFHVKHVAK